MAGKRYIRVASGAIYPYIEALAKRRTSAVLTEAEYAAELHAAGVDNEITRRHPPAQAVPGEQAEHADVPGKKPRKPRAKKATAEPVGVGMSPIGDEKFDKAFKDTFGDVQDLL